MKTATQYHFADLPTDYAGLCGLLVPRPVRDKVDLANVTQITDAMAGHELSPDQEDYFDLLCRLIEDYERDRVPAAKADALAALRHLLQEHDLSAADLSRLLGVHRTLGAMILRGKRNLTIEHVRVLVKHFNVAADLFL